MKTSLLTFTALALTGASVLSAEEKVSSGLAMQEARAENLKIKGPKT